MPISAQRPIDESPDTLDVLHADERCALANWGRYNLIVLRREVSTLGISLWARAMTQLKQGQPGVRFGNLTWVETECNFSQDQQAFPACIEALPRFSDCLAGCAVVYGREGFWNAAMRGRVMAVRNESKAGVPMTMHPNLPDAYAWLSEQASDLPTIAQPALTRAMDALRRA